MSTNQLQEYRPDDRTRAELKKFGQIGIIAAALSIFVCLLQEYVIIKQIIYLRKTSPKADPLDNWLFGGLGVVAMASAVLCYAASTRLLKALRTNDGTDIYPAIRLFRIWLQVGLLMVLLNVFVFVRVIWHAPQIYGW